MGEDSRWTNPCATFDCSFGRFGFIVQTNRHTTHMQTTLNALLPHASKKLFSVNIAVIESKAIARLVVLEFFPSLPLLYPSFFSLPLIQLGALRERCEHFGDIFEARKRFWWQKNISSLMHV